MRVHGLLRLGEMAAIRHLVTQLSNVLSAETLASPPDVGEKYAFLRGQGYFVQACFGFDHADDVAGFVFELFR